MLLSDFSQSERGSRTRWVADVPATPTQEAHELIIEGPGALVQEMFGDADLDVTVDPRRAQDQVTAEFDRARRELRRTMWDLSALEDTSALLKPAAGSPDPDTTVFASVRGVSGPGTPFALVVSSFVVPSGANLFFLGSFVFTAVGSLRPASGDQDLFLRLFSPTGTTVSSSILGGTSLDFVWFTFPLFPFVPVFQVFGFAGGTCAVFAAQGA